MLKRVLIIFVALGLLAGCDISKGLDAAGDAYKGATLSDAEVAQLGKQAADQMDSEAKVAGKNKYTARLAKITKNLKNEDGLTLNFKVYMTEEINAFALPDGSIRVYSGLMDLMKDDNEVLYVIGHEIGHVKEGHTKNRFKMVYATSAARKGAEAAGGAAAALSTSELSDLGEAFIHAQFSQKQEYSADGNGLALLKKYKKNPNAAVSALRKLASLGGGSGMMSSHPDSNDRADRLQKEIQQGTAGK